MRVYLSGPMTGLPDYNFPAFHAAAEQLRERGFEVINPAEMDSEAELADVAAEPTYGPTYQALLDRDLAVIRDPACGIKAIVTLVGWSASKGATREVAAAMARDLPVIPLVDALAWEGAAR